MCQFSAGKLFDLYKVIHFRTYYLREKEKEKYIIYEHIPSPMVNCLYFYNFFEASNRQVNCVRASFLYSFVIFTAFYPL